MAVRRFLQIILLLVLPQLVFAQSTRSFPDEELFPFYHGVASGDPLEDRVIIWTRVSPVEAKDNIEVAWRMATDTGMVNLVAEGVFDTNLNRDFTVKVDVEGLNAGTWYYYDFMALDQYSLRGRTRTLPTGDVDHLRFAVASCSNYEHGYFNAYKHIAFRNDLQAVLHLGDYQYEYQVGGYSAFIEGRQNEPTNETISLEDYRIRHSHYKLDEDLRAAHQQYPWFTVWDDHEFANNAWVGGAENHDAGEGLWSDRKAFSKKAYFEWMPVREQEEDLIRRSVDFGDLLRVYFLDTRIEGRDEQVNIGSNEVNSTDRTLLGQDQKDWLSASMESSEAKWNVLAQQVMVAPLEAFGLEINTDQWDGYQADRNWLYSTVQGIDLSNFVVLTGDIHTAWANNLPLSNYNELTEVGSVGVEFVCTSVTSEALPIDLGEGLVQFLNPHVEYVDLNEHGYMILDLNENRAQADWYYMNDLEISQYGEYLGASYLVYCDETFLDPADFPATGEVNDAPFAPLDPFNGEVGIEDIPGLNIVSAYPNPTQTKLTVQWACFRDQSLSFSLLDLSGNILSTQSLGQMPSGLHYITLSMEGLPAGMYLLRLHSDSGVSTLKVLKH